MHAVKFIRLDIWEWYEANRLECIFVNLPLIPLSLLHAADSTDDLWRQTLISLKLMLGYAHLAAICDHYYIRSKVTCNVALLEKRNIFKQIKRYLKGYNKIYRGLSPCCITYNNLKIPNFWSPQVFNHGQQFGF